MVKTIFNLQRFQILQTKLNPATTNLITNDYSYAWYKKIYPVLDENDLHEDLQEYFTISKDQINDILNYADSEWRDGRTYTFYEYEAHYNSRRNPILDITRSTLIYVFRYIYLNDGFDQNFWNKLLQQMEHPMEANGITKVFTVNELYLI